jgi:hypothetical protein
VDRAVGRSRAPQRPRRSTSASDDWKAQQAERRQLREQVAKVEEAIYRQSLRLEEPSRDCSCDASAADRTAMAWAGHPPAAEATSPQRDLPSHKAQPGSCGNQPT